MSSSPDGNGVAASATADVEPVAYHSNALEELLGRAQSWITAAENLRSNIRLVIEAERQCAQRLRKLAVGQDSAVSFAVTQRPKDDKGVPVKDSLSSAAELCFQSLPLKLAQHHEEVAKVLTGLEAGKAKEVHKAAKTHKSAVETAVVNLWESVDGTRNALREKAKTLQNSESGQQDGQVDVWLLRVQAAAARKQERDVSATFCQQASSLWAEVRDIEQTLVGKMGEVMTLFLTAQSAAAASLDGDIQSHARSTRGLDGLADWQLFASQPRVAPSVNASPHHADWRGWAGPGTQRALEDEARGSVMACGGDGEVVVSGLLQRQGTVIKFNWHKCVPALPNRGLSGEKLLSAFRFRGFFFKRHFFVLTASGFLHYFPTASDCVPDASFHLPSYRSKSMLCDDLLCAPAWTPVPVEVAFALLRLASQHSWVEVGVEKEIMTILLHAKSKSWFSSSAPTKVVVQTDSTSQTPLDAWERALSGFAVPLPSEPEPVG